MPILICIEHHLPQMLRRWCRTALRSAGRMESNAVAARRLATDGSPKLWGGRFVGAVDPLADNSYAPFAYDAVFAIAHALHILIEGRRVDAIEGDALMQTLLNDVSFEGVTGRVAFYSGSAQADAPTAEAGRRQRPACPPTWRSCTPR